MDAAGDVRTVKIVWAPRQRAGIIQGRACRPESTRGATRKSAVAMLGNRLGKTCLLSAADAEDGPDPVLYPLAPRSCVLGACLDPFDLLADGGLPLCRVQSLGIAKAVCRSLRWRQEKDFVHESDTPSALWSSSTRWEILGSRLPVRRPEKGVSGVPG